MKKRFALMMAAVMVLSLTACGSKPSGGGTGDAADAEVSGEEDTGGSQETRSIRVGTLPFAGSVPVAYALEQGYFTDAGLDVEQYEFATGAPMNEAFAAGQLDVAVIGLAGVISMSTGNAVCIYETNVASGGNGIFVREDSPLASEEITADALKGMNFIGQLATSSQLMVIQFLEKYGLSQDDVNFINMDSGADYQAFKSGEGDAVALMTPYAWNAEDEGYVCIYDFAEKSDYVVPDTMLATVSCMEKDRDTVKGFLEVYLKALEELSADEELMFNYSRDYYAACGREYSDEYVKKDLETRYLISKEKISQEGYIYGHGMWEVAKVFVEAGKIEEANLHNVTDCLDTSLLEEICGIQVEKESGN